MTFQPSTSSSATWENKYATKFTILYNLANAKPDNIVSGKTVCGINGTHVCSSTVAAGELGTNNSISWRVYRDGTLAVDGSGAVPSYGATGGPWSNYSNIITSVLIGDGIYEIGEYAFAFLYNVNNIGLSNSVHKIKRCAFFRTGAKTSLCVYLPASIYSIGDYAFGSTADGDIKDLTEVRFTGNFPAGGVASDAFAKNVILFEVPWDSDVRMTTSMCGGTVSRSVYNYNPQTDQGSFM